MKNLFLLFCFVLIPFLFPVKSYSQGKYDISVGLGIPEGYNIGLRSNYANNQRFDFYFGYSVPFEKDPKWVSIAINHAFYFGKINPNAQLKLWSVNTGLLYGISSKKNRGVRNTFLNLYFAREIIIKQKFYVEPKLGCSYLLSYDVYRGYLNGYIIRLIPNFGVNFGLKL